jgi:acetyl esterase/lipase
LEYATPGGVSLTLDIKYPSGQGPYPVILLPPHYGNWKEDGLKKDTRYRVVLTGLTSHGYAIVIPHYRPVGTYRFPAQIEDGKSLIRWLRANGNRLALATDRIGAVGASVAGYGVCMLGTTGPGDGFDPPGADPKAARLQAVVALGSPVDLTGRQWSSVAERLYAEPFLGKSFDEDPKLYTRASPGTYATPDDPPFLLIHSVRDPFVPVAQPRAFAAQLRRAGVAVELVEEDAVEHVWGGERLEKTVTTVVKFLDRNIRQ